MFFWLVNILSSTGGKQYEVGHSVDNLDEKKFLRWKARVSIEKQEARIYYMLKNHEKWLRDEEKSALDYFHGIGIYKKYQDPRKTFLKKMEDKPIE